MTAGRWRTIFPLLGATAWIVVALACAVLTQVVLNSGSIAPGPLELNDGAGRSALAKLLAVAFVFQGIMLLAALWQGWRLGHGEWAAGLGSGPARNKGLVLILCGVVTVWLTALLLLTAAFPALRDFAKSSSTELLSGLGNAGPGIVVPGILLLTVLAPLSEELFFRGWLWESLRRRGHGIVTIGMITTIPWLALHALDSPGRVLFLIPAAITLFTARLVGGGVRASLAVHVTNNSAAVLVEVVVFLVK